jgi:hypothetical protein
MPHAPFALIARQRAALRALHEETARRLRGAGASARQQVLPALARFTRAYSAEYARVNEDGDDESSRRQPVPLLWLYRSGQLRTLRASVVRAATVAAGVAAAATLAGQRQAFTLGQHNAATLLAASQDERAISPLVVPPVPSQRLGMSAFTAGVPLSSSFTALPGNAWDAVSKAASAGVATGQSGDALLAALLAAFMGQTLTRALVIGENEVTAAYRQMVTLTFQANPDAVTGWVWICSFDHSCAACIAMHGSIHDADEPMASHANCNCMQMPYKGDAPAMQTGEQWFAQQDADTQQSILGPAAYNALRQGDLSSISDLLDTSQGYVSQASLKSLGLDARDYLS